MKQDIPRLGTGWSEIFVYAAIGLGPLCFAWSSSAQVAQGRFAIEEMQVVAAMRGSQLPTDGVQIRLPAALSASVSSARIEVQAVTPALPHQVRLKLGCTDHSECLPFLATATYPDAVDVTTLSSASNAKGASALPFRSQSSATEFEAAPLAHTAPTANAAILKAGSTAMLQFEAEKLHIRIEVISLQSGVPGSRVRVSSLDHKQIYTAEVVTPTLLKGKILQ